MSTVGKVGIVSLLIMSFGFAVGLVGMAFLSPKDAMNVAAPFVFAGGLFFVVQMIHEAWRCWMRGRR